jgi:hypothetical protein
MLDQQAPHSKLNSIPLVGWNPLLPQRLGYNAEHGAAVQSLTASLDGVNLQRANPA